MKMKTGRTSSGNLRNPEAHEAILQAATTLLREKGYAGVTIEAVARLSGTGKPTIYRWWPNKAALFMEVYDREGAALLAIPDMGSVAKELVQLMRNLFSFWRDTASGQTMRSLIAEAQADPAALAQLREVFIPQRRIYSNTVLERAKQRGELPANTNVELLVDYLFGISWFRLLLDQIADDRANIEAMIQMILHGASHQEKAPKKH